MSSPRVYKSLQLLKLDRGSVLPAGTCKRCAIVFKDFLLLSLICVKESGECGSELSAGAAGRKSSAITVIRVAPTSEQLSDVS